MNSKTQSCRLKTFSSFVCKVFFIYFACLVSVKAIPITSEQQVFIDQLQGGDFFYPVIESGPFAGQIAVFEEPSVAFASADGFWRSLLKATAVVGGAIVASPIPGGTAVGAAATATFVTSMNIAGPGPGKKWLISDARVYESVEVAGLGDILPSVISAAQSNIVSSAALTPNLTLSFIDTNVISAAAKDSAGQLIGTTSLTQTFLLTNNSGPAIENLFGSVVLNQIGFADSVPLSNIDFLDIDVGPLLTAPDGTEVTVRSTTFVGFTAISEPSLPLMFLLGILLIRRFSPQGMRNE